MYLFNNIQTPQGVFCYYGAEEFEEYGPVHEAEGLGDLAGLYRAGSEGEGLVEEALSVPEAAVRLPGYGKEGVSLVAYPLLGKYLFEVCLDAGEGDPPEVEALAPGEYGQRDFMDLGGGEYEYGVRGRLLEGLKEGVKGGSGEHVDLVYYIDPVPAARGHVHYVLPQLPDVFHPRVRGAVYLEDVHRRTRCYAPAGLAVVAGRGCGAGRAVEALGEYPGRGGLAHAPGPGEEGGVGDPAR